MSSDKKTGVFPAIGKFFQSGFVRIQTSMMETMGLGRAATISALILIVLVTLLIVFLFIRFTPPKTIIMTSGDEDRKSVV